jgi:hypothetical protein
MENEPVSNFPTDFNTAADMVNESVQIFKAVFRAVKTSVIDTDSVKSLDKA